jgi:serine phosphatase RsbU (regulator of sigma subunit)
MQHSYSYLFFYLFFFLCSFFGFSQTQKKADSLLAILSTNTHDTTKVIVWLQIANLYLHEDSTQFVTYLKKAETLAQQKKYFDLQARCKRAFAVYLNKVEGKSIAATKYYYESIRLFEVEKNYTEIAQNYHSLGFIYSIIGDYPSALRCAVKILKMPEIQTDTKMMVKGYTLLAQIYYMQDDFKQAVSYQAKSLEFARKEGDEDKIATLLNNLAVFSLSNKEYEKAISANKEAIAIYQKLGDSLAMSYPIHNLGDVYLNMKQYKKALPFFELSVRLSEEGGSSLELAIDYITIGMCYVGMGKADKAESYAKKGLELAKNNQEYNSIVSSYEVFAMIDSMRGDCERSAKYYKMSVKLRDSISNTEKSEQLNRMTTMYETDRKETENLILKKEQEKIQATVKLQYFLLAAGMIGFLLCIWLATVYYKASRRRKIANQLLQVQQKEIAEKNQELWLQNRETQGIVETVRLQNNKLEVQHKEITDSIAYAQRIQQAMLPFNNRFDATFGEENYFIYYQPRNVVSGDFYWLYEGENAENQATILILADCTGHGVPGAFMSMIGIQLLQKIVIQKNILLPNEILANLQEEIVYVMQQKQSKTYDGMDVVILSIDKTQKQVLFAGAMNSIYYIQNNELFEEKGDKNMIGGVNLHTERNFNLKTIDCNIATTFYLFSDGYQDQFGGKNNKKFSSKQMKELLLKNCEKPMNSQAKTIETTIQAWMLAANETQTDDMTVIGLKI